MDTGRVSTKAIAAKLTKAVQLEVLRLESTGMSRAAIAEKIGVHKPFLSAFMRGNEKSLKGLAIPKLITMAESLGLHVDVRIKKK